MKTLFFAALLFPFVAYGIAIPGYLRPTHPAPTGHYHHAELLNHTQEYEEFEWLWVRTGKGQQGWVLKSSVLLPLDFSRRAILSGSYYVFKRPSARGKERLRLKGKRIVNVLARKRRFFKIQYKNNGVVSEGWVKDQHLRPMAKDAGYFLSLANVELKKQPKLHGRTLTRIPGETRLVPIKVKDDWALVRTGNLRGYIPLSHLKTRLTSSTKVRTKTGYHKPHRKLFRGQIMEIFPNPLWVGNGNYTLALKAKPDMSSPTVATLPPWTNLNLKGHAVQRWGRSRLPREGDIWWPAEFIESSVNITDRHQKQAYKLPKKSILQELQSPLISGLRFASTPYGVFRAHRGRHWRQVGDFKKGQPLTVSRNGTLFVGDKVSFDHGQTFKDYIRWDKVFEILPGDPGLSEEPIRIIQVAPQKKDPKQIYVSIKVGTEKNYTLFTPDFGQSWKRL